MQAVGVTYLGAPIHVLVREPVLLQPLLDGPLEGEVGLNGAGRQLEPGCDAGETATARQRDDGTPA